MKLKLKLNYRLSLYMLSTYWARVCWGITPVAPCTNIKNYWSAKHSCASNIRNYMSYANYAATNQIHVFSCNFFDVIIIPNIGFTAVPGRPIIFDIGLEAKEGIPRSSLSYFVDSM